MAEWKLFPDGVIPEYTTFDWYQTRERAPHLEQPEHRDRILLAASWAVDAAVKLVRLGEPPSGIVDLGSGDGGLLLTIRRIRSPIMAGCRTWGYDFSQAQADAAREVRGVDVTQLDVLSDPIKWADIAIATEMLEHLVDPHGFVREVARHSKVLIASSPVWETLDSHYEFHTWAWDQEGYAQLLSQNGFSVARHEVVGGAQVIMGVR